MTEIETAEVPTAEETRANAVFDLLAAHEVYASAGQRVSARDLAAALGCSVGSIHAAVHYLRTQIDPRLVVTFKARHKSGFALGDTSQAVDHYQLTRLKEESTRIRTMSATEQKRLVAFGADVLAEVIARDMGRIASDVDDYVGRIEQRMAATS